MFKKIVLDNFKSFGHIELDLTGSKGVPKKSAFIYGENGSGKSNLLYSFVFLKESMNTLSLSNRMQEFLDKMQDELSSDEVKHSKDTTELIKDIILNIPVDLKELAKSAKLVNSEKGIKLEYHFYIDGKDGCYTLSFDKNNSLEHEKLDYLINERIGNLFKINYKNENIKKSFSSSFFNNNDYKSQMERLIDQYWGKHTFLAILERQEDENNESFTKTVINENALKAFSFLDGFSVRCNVSDKRQKNYHDIPNEILSQLAKGTISTDEKRDLDIFEKTLNDFFTRIYSDIKSVYYKAEIKEDKIEYELYFKKLISGKLRDISYKEESTGTQKLLGIFPFFYECAIGKVAIIDEIDTGIHDLLMNYIIEELGETFTGQFIATTHNTLLLEKIKPENAYIIQVDDIGDKEICCIKDINIKTQPNHNNRIRYLAGLFNGVPMPGFIDFSNIVKRANMRLGEKQ